MKYTSLTRRPSQFLLDELLYSRHGLQQELDGLFFNYIWTQNKAIITPLYSDEGRTQTMTINLAVSLDHLLAVPHLVGFRNDNNGVLCP